MQIYKPKLVEVLLFLLYCSKLFCWKGTSIGHDTWMFAYVLSYIYITQMSQRAGKEIFEDNKDIAFV